MKRWAEIKENNTNHEIANGHGLGILVRGAILIMQMEELPEIMPALKSKEVLLNDCRKRRTSKIRQPTYPVEKSRIDDR